MDRVDANEKKVSKGHKSEWEIWKIINKDVGLQNMVIIPDFSYHTTKTCFPLQ